jgi:cytochrome c oxidase assembly factor CtaG
MWIVVLALLGGGYWYGSEGMALRQIGWIVLMMVAALHLFLGLWPFRTMHRILNHIWPIPELKRDQE